MVLDLHVVIDYEKSQENRRPIKDIKETQLHSVLNFEAPSDGDDGKSKNVNVGPRGNLVNTKDEFRVSVERDSGELSSLGRSTCFVFARQTLRTPSFVPRQSSSIISSINNVTLPTTIIIKLTGKYTL